MILVTAVVIISALRAFSFVQLPRDFGASFIAVNSIGTKGLPDASSEPVFHWKGSVVRSRSSLSRVLTMNGPSGVPLVAFHVSTTHEGIVRYLQAHSVEWLREVNTVGALFFTVGRTSMGEDTLKASATLAEVRRRFPGVTVFETDADDSEYPPITKTLQALDRISDDFAPRFPFVYILDDDSHFAPLRLAALVAQRDPEQPLYMGRPLHNCKCFPGGLSGYNCTAHGGTAYCSGAGYAMSRATLRSMAGGGWSRCLEQRRANFDLCDSVDTFVGFCLQQTASPVVCSPAVALPSPMLSSSMESNALGPLAPWLAAAANATAKSISPAQPPAGETWGPIQPNGWGLPIRTLVCVDQQYIGGAEQRYHTANVHSFTDSDRAFCALIYPTKVNGEISAPHTRYVRFLFNEAVETPLLSLAALDVESESSEERSSVRAIVTDAGRCQLAINIQVRRCLRTTMLYGYFSSLSQPFCLVRAPLRTRSIEPRSVLHGCE